MTDDEFQSLANGDVQWFCARCEGVRLESPPMSPKKAKNIYITRSIDDF